MNKGVFVRLYDLNQELTVEGVTRINYVSSENAEDYSTITIETEQVGLVDHPILQDNKKVILVWGYTGEVTTKRILYIWSIKASFTASGLRIDLDAVPRAAYLKLTSSKDVYPKGSTIEDVLDKYGEAYNLDINVNVGKGIVGVPHGGHHPGQTPKQINVNLPKFKPHESGIPQGNRDDASQLNQLVAMDSNHDMYWQGTDDKLLITSRDFSKGPKREYSWKGGTGELISFTPASSQDSKKDGVASSVGVWDPLKKEYRQSEIPYSDRVANADLFSDFVDLSLDQTVKQLLAQLGEKELGRPVVIDNLLQEREVKSEEHGGKTVTRWVSVVEDEVDRNAPLKFWWHISGAIPSKVNKPKGIFVDVLRKQVLDDPIFSIRGGKYTELPGNAKIIMPEGKRAGDIVESTMGNRPTAGVFKGDTSFYDNRVALNFLESVISNPRSIFTSSDFEDAVPQATNKLFEDSLELSQIQAEVLGDTTLEVGDIITILGVGKRYSQNYYIAMVNHEIAPERGYVCTLKLYSTGIFNSPDFKVVPASDIAANKNTKRVSEEDSRFIAVPTKQD